MITPPTWSAAGPLPGAPRVFLEASAGTGKTFAIEGIVVQLVAEEGLTIDQILVITFTNAATAELRDRVRQRMVKVSQVLKGAQEAGDDKLAERLSKAADPELLARRLSQALADIDRAAISTIHSFCQRMLQELAFESGQESELEVLGEATEVREQLVADALARVYARASEEDLRLLTDMAWTPDGLRAVAKKMTGATQPTPRPAPQPGLADPLAVLQQWRAELAQFKSWCGSEGGRAALAAWQAERALPSKSAAKSKMPYSRMGLAPKDLGEKVLSWLNSPGLLSERPFVSGVQWLDPAVVTERWAGDEPAARQFAGYPLAVEFTKLCAVQARLWSQPLVQFASTVRADFQTEIDRRAQLTYDGMLSRLAERLVHERQSGGSLLADAIRSRYRAALVDEFQDTDMAQWQVVDAVFGRNDTRFFVVGDPKQSIYRFRGADLDVYLAAREQAVCYQLDTNYRADTPLVDALNTLWLASKLPLSMGDVGDVGDVVNYVHVNADKDISIEGLPPNPGADARPRRPLEVRLCMAQADGGDLDSAPNKADMTAALAQLCACECLKLLQSSCKIVPKGSKVARPLAPGDLAVLVPSHREAAIVRNQLARLAIPAVAAGRGSIYGSEALGWLVAWLDAVANPASERPARLLAVSPLIGWTADQLTRAVAEPASGAKLNDDQQAWQALRQHMASLANTWVTQGFARVLDKTLAKFDVLARLLGSLWGERGATDLRHLTELCQAEDRRTRAGPRGLAEWLRACQASADDKSDEQATRLESDAAAVQLVTVHASKGLEYPVVLLPFAWAPTAEKEKRQPLLMRDQGVTQLDMSAPGSHDRQGAKDWSDRAAEAESVRLLYVALTRARNHAVVWLNRMDFKAKGALSRLVLGDEVAKALCAKAKDADPQGAWSGAVQARLQELQSDAAGGIGWSIELAPTSEKPWQSASNDPLVLPLAQPFDPERPLGARWQVASFSSLAAGRGADDDEPTRKLADLATTISGQSSAQPEEESSEGATVEAGALDDLAKHPWMLEKAAGAELPGGTTTGDWIHGVFEELDFKEQDSGGLVAKDGESAHKLVGELAQRYGVQPPKKGEEPIAALEALLPLWLTTPLGVEATTLGLPADFTLQKLELSHRLDELGFDMRLGAGADYRVPVGDASKRGAGCIDVAGVRKAFEIGAAVEDFGGATWCKTMLDRGGDQVKAILPEIAGFLTGFIDLTFRVGGSGADARYYIADYKSNAIRGPEWLSGRLAEAAKRNSIEQVPRLANVHYTRPLLQWAMAHAGYHLQALVYTVALHRLLQTRLGSNYSYRKHIGGHLYLFLKGMAGPATPRWQGSCLGVWADRWPEEAVLALDAALLGSSTPLPGPSTEVA